MPKIDITKIIYVCDSCNKHFTDNSGSVLTFEASNKKITLCDKCTRDLSEGLEDFISSNASVYGELTKATDQRAFVATGYIEAEASGIDEY